MGVDKDNQQLKLVLLAVVHPTGLPVLVTITTGLHPETSNLQSITQVTEIIISIIPVTGIIIMEIRISIPEIKT